MPDDSDWVEIECRDDDERVVVVSLHEYIEYECHSDSFLHHVPAHIVSFTLASTT
jgi:hypothetical protein